MMKLTEKIFVCLMVALVLPMCLLPLSLRAQSEVLWVDQASFEPVQKDVVTGLRIDAIGKDRSNRPCARLKIHLNRMTPEDIAATRLKPIGGNAVVMKNVMSMDQTGLIVEVTAVGELTFLLHNDKFGDSNPVTVSLQPDREYLIKAQCRATYSINVMCGTVGAEVYLDRRMAGTIGPDNTLTVSDVEVGPHHIELKYNGQSVTQDIEVNPKKIFFHLNFSAQETVINKLYITVEPAKAVFLLNGLAIDLVNGKKSLSVASGKHDYLVTADEYFPEDGSFFFTGKEPLPLQVKLKPKFGYLDCTAMSPTCSVYLDNEYIGQSSAIKNLHVPMGPHELRLEADMYLPQTLQANVTSGLQIRPDLPLEPDFAEFRISGPEVQHAQITLNGEPIDPGKIYRKAPGEYELKIFSTMYRELSETLTMQRGDQIFLEPDLIDDFARVTLSVANGADIYLDGTYIGAGKKTTDIPTGTHEIVTTLPNHSKVTRTLEIDPSMTGQTIELEAPELVAGQVRILSEPSGLSVYVDNEMVGKTPYYSNEFPVGHHKILLLHDNSNKKLSFNVDVSRDGVYEFNKSLPAAVRYERNMAKRVAAWKVERKASDRTASSSGDSDDSWWNQFGGTDVTTKSDTGHGNNTEEDDWWDTYGSGHSPKRKAGHARPTDSTKGIIYTVDIFGGWQSNTGYLSMKESGILEYGNCTPMEIGASIGYQFGRCFSLSIGTGVFFNAKDLRSISVTGPEGFQDELDKDRYTDFKYKQVDIPLFANAKFYTKSDLYFLGSLSGGYYPLNKTALLEVGVGVGARLHKLSKFEIMGVIKSTPWPDFQENTVIGLSSPTVGIKVAINF